MSQNSVGELAKPEYWDRRYLGIDTANREEGAGGNNQDSRSHEWFRSFERIRPFLLKNLPPVAENPRIVHMGCGTSVSMK